MKTRKNKVTNLFKIGILFFGISLLLWNCEQEQLLEEQPLVEKTVTPLFNELQNQFNKKDFEKTISYKYEVDWSNVTKLYSEQLESYFYEFPIVYSNAFNPDVFNQQNKRAFSEKYKIIVTEKEEGGFEFYIAKYFLKNSDTSSSVDYNKLFINLSNGYDGTVHLYDSTNEMVFAKHISSKEELNDFYLKPTIDKGNDENLQQRWVDVCTSITIYHYKDWYYVTYNNQTGAIISSTYSHTTLEGTSRRRTCRRGWLPDPRPIEQEPCFEGTSSNGFSQCAMEEFEPTIICPEGYTNSYGRCLSPITSLPELSQNDSVDNYENQILKMTTHLKQFGNPEDEFFADYVNSLTPNFNSMTVGDVYDIYKLTRTQVHNLTEKYAYSIITSFAEAAYPFVVYALTEATLGAALPLLSRIPLSMVLRGQRLEKMVKQIGLIGVRGSNNTIRIVTTSNPVQKAERLFATLTKNAISKTTYPNGTIVANMGSGNLIKYRTASSSGFPATIELEFFQIWSQARKIKFN